MDIQEVAEELQEYGNTLEKRVEKLDGYVFFVGIENEEDEKLSDVSNIGFTDSNFLLSVLANIIHKLEDEYNIIVEYNIRIKEDLESQS